MEAEQKKRRAGRAREAGRASSHRVGSQRRCQLSFNSLEVFKQWADIVNVFFLI